MTLMCNRRHLLMAAACSAATALPAMAQLRIEISGVGANQIPIALLPLNGTRETGIDVMRVVLSDLSRTGGFRFAENVAETGLEESMKPDLLSWKSKDMAMVASGTILHLSDGSWEVTYRLFDTVRGEQIDQMKFVATDKQLRMVAHRIADRIYDRLTGLGSLFSSRLAYVVQRAKNDFQLIVAESDGANAVAALKSSEPIISPAWSPDGTKLAYVSFESRKPVVYVHTLATGKREMLANFRGNNSAPAFSPDGKQLAVALSRDGYTQIFLLSLDGTGVKRFSRSIAIDTEPVFSPDGKYIYFTSDRGGSAQIYRQPVNGTEAERVTFNGDYNVSPSVNATGTHLAYVTRVKGQYRTAVMDIATGQEMILSRTDRDESPCFSPNGRVVVFATENQGQGVLASASVDGSVRGLLTGATGDIREPTWGPILP